tara:strand:+ start:3315 stop:4367 length:1053 start_codon:yes stop_codon:yes gene_type:complete
MKKEIRVKRDISVRSAMNKLEKTAEKCLIVVDEKGRLLGTLTDGDIRRSILKGSKFSEDISNLYNPKPFTLIEDSFTKDEATQTLINSKLDLIPIIKKNKSVKDYVTLSSLRGHQNHQKQLNDTPVVIMAGGQGTRMAPFTKVLPKPLIPIQDKPIIEHIIKRFTDVSCSEFYLTINYKGKILKAYFEELNPNYTVNFIKETQPLGTAGSLKFLTDKIKIPFFVTNCDIIIKTDLKEVYNFHKKGGYDITLIASAKEYTIPYGTCNLEKNGDLLNIQEKPKFDFLINAGLYILNPDVLENIPKDKFYNITDLIENVIKKKKRVGVYPIDDEFWIDIGQWEEYQKAIKKLL